MPASHSQAAAPLAGRSALTEGSARLWARHESLSCLLFAVAATLAVALVERALGSQGATWHAVSPLRVGLDPIADPCNYTVE